MARVKVIGKAQKPQGKCQKCGTEIKAGDPYRYFKVGFRSRVKNVRCMADACTPRPSELTSSKMSGAYAAQEDAHDAIDAAATYDEIVQALEDCAQAAREVVSEYEEAVENAPMLEDQVRPNIDALEAWADELDSHSDLPDPEDAEGEKCEHCGGTGQCDIAGDEYDDDDECSECKATHTEPACQMCDGEGTYAAEETDNDEALEEVKEAARTIVDSLEA